MAQAGAPDPGGTVFQLPDAQATTPAPFVPVEPTRPLPAPGQPQTVVPPSAPDVAREPARPAPAADAAPMREAQQPAPEEPAAEAVPVPDASATAGAQPAAGGPSVERETFGDWVLECFDPVRQGPRCQIQHRLASGGQTVLVVALAKQTSDEAADLQLALPLGFALTPGVRIEVNTIFEASIPVNRCTAQGCLVEGKATPELVAAMRRGDVAIVAVQTVEDTPVRLPLSLDGFTAAYRAMEQRG